MCYIHVHYIDVYMYMYQYKYSIIKLTIKLFIQTIDAIEIRGQNNPLE